MSAPKVTNVYAFRNATTRVHATQRMLPVIFVPGMLGTRLSDSKTGKLVWNPTGIPFGPGPRPFKVDYDRLNQPAPLIPDEKNGFKDREQKRRYKHIVHYNNVVGTLYGDMLLELSRMQRGAFEQFGVKPKVYCCGYDWRQDNAHSALRLAQVVEEALHECRADKCIIVAHEMGGLVARYYCHVLGGEKRVHAMFLLGSPTMGTPEAYGKLKSGLGGPNPRNPVGLGIWALTTLFNPSELENMYKNLYLMLCMGAGRLLTGTETRTFCRQMASMYQLLPNSIYCKDNQHWTVFDPLQTGHPPTGTMFVFPSLMDGLVTAGTELLATIDEGAEAAGEELKGYYEEYMTPGKALRTSARAERNVMTLEKFAEELAEAMEKLEKDEDGYQLHKIYKQIKEIYDRAEECILDCQAHDHFYRDIYTGLLDVVHERALCSAHLEVALRFEEALKNGEGSAHVGGHGILRTILRPLLALAGVSDADHGGGASTGHDGEGEHQEDAYAGPKVYMHPKTFNIYCDTQNMSVAFVCMHTETLSNDDSNEVHFQLMPIPFGATGDGNVPASSANPPTSRLTHAFEMSRGFPNVPYSRMTNENEVISFIAARIDALVASFCTET
jgi:hypothetical protein